MAQVRITSYEVAPGRDTVKVSLEIGLPSGVVNTSVDVFVNSLDYVANARSAATWDEQDLATIISSLIEQLSHNVTW